MLPLVSLIEEAVLVGVKPSLGGLLELGDGLLDVFAQHLGGSRVCEGDGLVQGGLMSHEKLWLLRVCILRVTSQQTTLCTMLHTVSYVPSLYCVRAVT